MAEQCECWAETGNRPYRIHYCPLHKAAPEMLKALEALDAALAPYSDGLRRSHLAMNNTEKRIYDKHLEARTAIAQARGQEVGA